MDTLSHHGSDAPSTTGAAGMGDEDGGDSDLEGIGGSLVSDTTSTHGPFASSEFGRPNWRHAATSGLHGFKELMTSLAARIAAKLRREVLLSDSQSYSVLSNDGDDDADPEPASFAGSMLAMVKSSWLNLLLVFVPLGLVAYLIDISPVFTFVANAVAIVPLSTLLTDATERIAADSGDTVGALINISLGNLVELILLVALQNNQIRIVEASILGSVLVNLLLILGSALLGSTTVNEKPLYNTSEAQLLACLLFVSVFVFLMPTAFDYTFQKDDKTKKLALKMSRMSSVIVFLIYILYFIYEMRLKAPSVSPSPSEVELGHSGQETVGRPPVSPFTPPPASEHGDEPQAVAETQLHTLPPRTIRFADEGAEAAAVASMDKAKATNKIELGVLQSGDEVDLAEERGRASQGTPRRNPYRPFGRSRSRSLSLGSVRGAISRDTSIDELRVARSGLTTLQMLRDNRADIPLPSHEASTEKPGNRAASITMLVLASALMSMSAEFLVSTIDDITHEGGLSESVIGLIIIPIVGNIAEYATVVTVALRNKLDLAIAVSVGSSIQIAICVTPLTVLAGWALRRDFALTFTLFEMASLVGTVLLVNLLVLNEANSSLRARGLKGALMVACYIIIGFGAYLSPDGRD